MAASLTPEEGAALRSVAAGKRKPLALTFAHPIPRVDQRWKYGPRSMHEFDYERAVPKVVILLPLAFLESEGRRPIPVVGPRLRVPQPAADDAARRLERA